MWSRVNELYPNWKPTNAYFNSPSQLFVAPQTSTGRLAATSQMCYVFAFLKCVPGLFSPNVRNNKRPHYWRFMVNAAGVRTSTGLLWYCCINTNACQSCLNKLTITPKNKSGCFYGTFFRILWEFKRTFQLKTLWEHSRLPFNLDDWLSTIQNVSRTVQEKCSSFVSMLLYIILVFHKFCGVIWGLSYTLKTFSKCCFEDIPLWFFSNIMTMFYRRTFNNPLTRQHPTF